MTKRRATQPKHPVTIEPKWKGEDVYILAGGTSVTLEQINLLRGRKVIAINSMYLLAPFAPAFFFADQRFFKREQNERKAKFDSFAGEIFTTSRGIEHPKLKKVRHLKPPPGLPPDAQTVCMARTSVAGAMGIAYLKGAGRMILIGVDNRDGPNGRIHCHPEHPWQRYASTWRDKESELSHIAKELRDKRIPVFNCSPISTLKFWPKVDLRDIVEGRI